MLIISNYMLISHAELLTTWFLGTDFIIPLNYIMSF